MNAQLQGRCTVSEKSRSTMSRLVSVSCLLLLICLTGVCHADEADRLKSRVQELQTALEQNFSSRDDFKQFLGKIKNVESSTLLSIVTALIEEAKAPLDATNIQSPCHQQALTDLQVLQTHAKLVFQNHDTRISDILTPEDQQYHDVGGNELAAAVGNLLQACKQSTPNCQYATFSNLQGRQTTFSRSIAPLEQANTQIRPFVKRISDIQSKYQACLKPQ